MRNLVTYGLSIISMLFLYSCRCSCDCKMEPGCAILTVKNRNTDTVVTVKTYCTTISLYADKKLSDSIDIFYAKYETSTTWIERRDSTKLLGKYTDLKCDETEQFEKAGYWCDCAK